MNRRAKAELTDEALRAMLLARARRADMTGLLEAVRRVADQTPQRKRLVLLLPGPVRLWSRLSIPAVVVAVMVLVASGVLLFGRGYPSGPGASGQPSAIASPPSPSPAAIGPAQPLTVAQLGRLLAGDRAALTSQELVVSGRLEMEPAPCPPGGAYCPPVVLVGLQPSLPLQPVADLGASNWPDVGRPVDGTFAMAFLDGVLQYHGTVSVAPDRGPWAPGTVPPAVAGRPLATDFVFVYGWLGAGSTMSCPTQLPVPSRQPDYGCGSHSWLTDNPWPAANVGEQPPTDPTQGMRVQNGAYDDFAISPVRVGAVASPRLGTFLVRWTFVNPCPAANGVISDCYVPQSAWHWQLVYRIDLSATVPVAPSTEVASPSQVPSAGGTCSASQFVLGEATNAYGYGTLGTTSMYVTQPLRNAGGNCVLDLPGMIRVASATGPLQSVTVVNGGTAASFSVRSGQALSIVLGAWWWIGGSTENGTPLPAPPCTDPISDVTRVEFPLALGGIQIDLGTVWHKVCSSPASVSVTVGD